MNQKGKIHLVDERRDPKTPYRTNQIVPESGIYRVTHSAHRLPHEVTLLKGQHFPRCGECADEVMFEPIAMAPHVERRGRIVLNELPEIKDPAA